MRMDESSENVTLDTRAGPSLEYTVMAVGLPLVIFIIGFAGNILVITVILKRRSLQTPTNCYLLSLCVADCILLISSNLPTIPEPLSGRKIGLTDLLCARCAFSWDIWAPMCPPFQ